MSATLFLAQYLGILMIVFGAAGIYKRKSFRRWLRRIARRPGVLTMIGMLEFAAGLFLIFAHQSWASFPAVLVSLVSWLMIIEGALYMFLPQASIARLLGRFNREDLIVASSIIGLGLGVVLVLFGFGIV